MPSPAPVPPAPAEAPDAPPSRLGPLAAAAILAAWVVFSRRFTGVDPDLFWHLKYGQLILAEHQLFNRDVFSWTAPGGFWLNQEWGGQVVMAWLHGLGGLGALETFHWLLFSLTAVLATHLFRRAGWAWPAAAFGAVVLHFLLYGQMVFRLQNFTTAFLLVTAYVLQTWWLTGRLGRLGWAYPLIVAAWANLHGGGAIAGLVSCGVVLAAEAIACLKTGRWAALRPLVYLCVGALVGLLLNPEGYHLPAHSLATLGDPTVKAVNAMVLEWHPFTWQNIHYRLFVLAVAAMGVAGLVGRRWPPLGMAALALAWGTMAMISRRNLALAPIAMAPLAAFWFHAAATALRPTARVFRLAGGVAAVGCGLVIVGVSPAFHRTDLSGAMAYPSGPALKATMALGKTHRMLNFYEWGGLFIFLGHPEVKVFIDGRAYHYGPRMMREYNEMMNLAPGWQAALGRYGADMVVAPPFIGLVQALAQDPAWTVAFEDATAVVVVKRPPGAPARRAP